MTDLQNIDRFAHDLANTQFDKQIHFNWGFHDGAYDAEHGRPYLHSHFDKLYKSGHNAGMEAFKANRPTHNSQSAWKERSA